MLDTSGSMGQPCENGISRIENATTAIAGVAQKLKEYTDSDTSCTALVKLIPFDTQAYVSRFRAENASAFISKGYFNGLQLNKYVVYS